MRLYQVSQEDSIHGAGTAEIFAFCNPFCFQKGPPSQKPSVTHSLCLSAYSTVRGVRGTPYSSRVSLFPVIADETASVQSLQPWEHTLTKLSPTCWLLSAHHTKPSSSAPRAISSTTCVCPLPTHGLALTLPPVQPGLGWGFSRAHENNVILIVAQWQLSINNSVTRFYPGT